MIPVKHPILDNTESQRLDYTAPRMTLQKIARESGTRKMFPLVKHSIRCDDDSVFTAFYIEITPEQYETLAHGESA